MLSLIWRKALGADLRYCSLLVMLIGFIMVVYFVMRLTIFPPNQIVSHSNTTISPRGLLLVLIHASGQGLVVRETIRKTWLSPLLFSKLNKDLHGYRVVYRFVLGIQGISNNLLSNLTKEFHMYKDMLLLENVTDEHETLSRRTLGSFQYVSENYKDFLYVLKCDDDSFVNLLAVTKQLSQRTITGRYYWGQFLGAGGIIREGAYAEHMWSVCETYLPYALGGGYVLSMDLVRLMAENAHHLRIYNNEDVSVGAWLAPYNIEYVFDSRFNTGAVSKGCKTPYIVMHRVSEDQMYSYFDGVMKEGRICTRKNYKFVWHGYRYNWKNPPSRCCRVRHKVP